MLPCSFSRFLALSVNRLPLGPLSAFPHLFPTKHIAAKRTRPICSRLKYAFKDKKKLHAEIILVSIKVEEIDQISFFSSFSFLSSSSLLIFSSFSCFSMPFSSDVLCYILFYFTCNCEASSSAWVFCLLFDSATFLLISLSDCKILSSDSRVHFCISIRIYTCKVPHTRVYNAKLSPSFKSYYIFFYFLLQEWNFFSLYCYIYFYFSLWLWSFYLDIVLSFSLRDCKVFLFFRSMCFRFLSYFADASSAVSFDGISRYANNGAKRPYRIVGSDTMTRAGEKRGESKRSRKENAWKTWIPSQDMRYSKSFPFATRIWPAKARARWKVL